MKKQNYKYMLSIGIALIMGGCSSYNEINFLNIDNVKRPNWYKKSNNKVLNKSFYYGLGEGKTISEARIDALLKIKREILKREILKKEKNFFQKKKRIKNKVYKKTINIGMEDIKLTNVLIDQLKTSKYGNRYFMKIRLGKVDLIEYYRREVEIYKKEMFENHKKAVYSKTPYYQYKYYTKIDNMMEEVINNEHILYLLEGNEKYKKGTYKVLNEYLDTFYKLKNNINFKIHSINDSNLLNFVKLSLIDKNFKLTNKENKYTLYLSFSIKKVKKEYEDSDYTYITVVKVSNKEDELYNSIVLRTQVKFKKTIEETMYNVYLDIKKQLNDRSLFN